MKLELIAQIKARLAPVEKEFDAAQEWAFTIPKHDWDSVEFLNKLNAARNALQAVNNYLNFDLEGRD